jgi:hypothetical protein
MAGKTAAEIFSGGGDPFVDADMRAALADNGVPFGIVGASAKVTGGEYGDETVFVIELSAKAVADVADVEPGTYRLTLKHTDVRERQANDVIAALGVPGNDKIGPLYLSQGTTKRGNPVWEIGTEPATEPVAQRAASSSSDGAASDDGIPY